MEITFTINGRKASEEKALQAYCAYEQENSGTSVRESIRVFNQAVERDMDGAIARDYLMDAGVEVFFHGTGSSYDAEPTHV